MDMAEIQAMWAEDVKIDEDNLDEELNRAGSLHSKYSVLFEEASVELAKMKVKMKRLERVKWLLYTEGPTQEQLAQGIRPPGKGKLIKSEAERYMSFDDDILDLTVEIGYHVRMVDFLGSVIDMIKFRSNTIKTMMELKKFKLGF